METRTYSTNKYWKKIHNFPVTNLLTFWNVSDTITGKFNRTGGKIKVLVKCPECELQVSDKALTCPHCGMPLKSQKTIRKKTARKHIRLPNGFGSITKMNKPNLRNPYRVRICVGKTSEGKPILKSLKPQSSFHTYNEAYEALVEYNRNPYDLDNDITVMDLYDKWSEEYFKNTTANYIRTVKSAWVYCSSIYDMRAKDVRVRHLKGCMDEGYRIEYKGNKKGTKIYPTARTKSRMKSLFNLMFDYALEFEIVDRNYARAFSISGDIVDEIKNNTQGHIIFTDEEMQILWDNVDHVPFVDWVLIQCYMGWRPQELATITLDEINIDEWYMKAGMKTEAGKQRIVPIHTKIHELVKRNYDKGVYLGTGRLLNDKGQTHSGTWKLTYDKYAARFSKVIKSLHLNPEHKPHDPRKTFATRCKKAGVDEYALKEMMGHSIKDITESVYTVRDLEWLRSDLEKLQ